MKQIFNLLLFFLFLNLKLYSNWNAEYESKTQELIQKIKQFNIESFLTQLEDFEKVKESVVNDKELIEAIGRVDEEAKRRFLFKDEGFVVKKRPCQKISEAFTWELSYLLKLSEYVVPSVPFEINGTKVILQKWESDIKRGDTAFTLPPVELITGIKLKDYWRANLLAYILSISDLTATNIGINNESNIRLFDNEHLLRKEGSKPFKCVGLVELFLNSSFDWPHYRTPLTTEMALSLKNTVDNLSESYDQILLYCEMRGIPERARHIINKIEILKRFHFQKGKTFQDLFAYLYPEIAEGLDELALLVSSILQKPVDHGRALLFASRGKQYWMSFREEHKAICRSWEIKTLNNFNNKNKWNQEYLAQTNDLINKIQSFNRKSYKTRINQLNLYKNNLITNPKLLAKLDEIEDAGKKRFHLDRFVVKKRPLNQIKESYVWELSYLIDLPEFLAPCYPIFVNGKKVIVQRWEESLVLGLNQLTLPYESQIKRVNLREYWRANFLTYLLGITDLIPTNIGINDYGEIRLFDSEHLLKTDGVDTFKKSCSLCEIFISSMFDWPHYKKPLDSKLVEEFQNFVKVLSQKKEEIELYSKERGVAELTKPLLSRINVLEGYTFKEGDTFENFFHYLYPEIVEGLPELNKWVEGVLGRPVGDGIALLFASRGKQYYPQFTPEHKIFIENWLNQTLKR